MADEDVAEGAGEAEEYIEAGEGPQQVPGRLWVPTHASSQANSEVAERLGRGLCFGGVRIELIKVNLRADYLMEPSGWATGSFIL